MSTCNVCGVPLQKSSSGLLKCPVCGLNYRIGSKTALLDTYVQKSPTLPQVATEEELTPDQKTFINRLTEKLIPLEGLTGDNLKRAIKIREQNRQELKEVFLGKRDWNKWFDQKRTERGLHLYTFTQMVYESLEGLRSPETKALQEQYAEAIKRITAR